MRIAILGTGTMGCLTAVLLHRAGAQVCLLGRSAETVQAINRSGVRVHAHGDISVYPVPAAMAADSAAAFPGGADALIVLVKGVDTAQAVRSAHAWIGTHTLLVTLQNGIGNADILASLHPAHRVMAGILEFAGKLLSPGEVRAMISPRSKIALAPVSGVIDGDMRALAAVLEKTGVRLVFGENVDSEIWIKLRNNASNVLFGLLRLPMGAALQTEGTNELITHIRDEVIAVARARGIAFTPEELLVNGGKTAVNPELYDHLPSTAQDMKNHRPTEAAFLNGAVVREGQRLGVPTPYNELLYGMVCILEKTYDKQF